MVAAFHFGHAILQFLVATLSWSGLSAYCRVRYRLLRLSDRAAGDHIRSPAGGRPGNARRRGRAKPWCGHTDRAERSVWTAAILNAGLLGLAGLFFVIFSGLVVSIFTTDPEVSVIASDCLRIVGYGYAFYGLGMVMESSFNGAGDTWTPTYLNFFVFWLFEIPLAYVLANHYGFGPQGVFWAITLSFSMLAVSAALLFKRGKWKLKTV